MAVDYLPTLAEAPVAAVIPGELERRQRERIAAALMAQGGSGEPIQHWAQGLNRVAQGLVGGYQLGELRRQGQAEEAKTQAIFDRYRQQASLGEGTPPAAMPQRQAETESPAAVPAAPTPPPQRMAALGPPSADPSLRRINEGFTDVKAAIDQGIVDPQGSAYPKTFTALPPSPTTALTSPTVPGAVPVQTQSIRPPAQVAQATPPVAAVHPLVQQEMRLGLDLMGNRPTRDAGLRVYMGALKAAQPNYGFQVIGDTIFRTDPRNGQAIPLMTAPQKPGLKDIKLPNGDEITVRVAADGSLTMPSVEGLPKAPAAGPDALPQPPPNLSKKAREEWEKEQVKLRVTQQGQRPGELRSAKIVVDNIDKAIQQADQGFVTGAAGQLLSKVGGTAAHDLSQTVQTIKANISIDKLNAMRAASPTGGALGNVTEGEHALLSATLGSVEQSQGKEQFKENLGRLKELYNEIIHGGVGKGPPETGRLGGTSGKPVEWERGPNGLPRIKQ